MTNLYIEFSNKALVGETGNWEWPTPLTANAHSYIDSLAWCNPTSERWFIILLTDCAPGTWLHVDRLKRLGLTSHVYPLADFNYGTTISRNIDGGLVLSIRLKLFADTGGTGLQYFEPIGVYVKMARGEGVYNKQKLTVKKEYYLTCCC